MARRRAPGLPYKRERRPPVPPVADRPCLRSFVRSSTAAAMLVERRRDALLFALVLLAPLATDGAPTGATMFYGVNLPDPLHVYALQELKPENIHNDPFLVVFKTHIPSLRPYEIPYFPPKDRLSAQEVDDDNVVASISGEIKKVELTENNSKKEPQAVSEGPDKEKPSDKFNIDNIPELVELKPEALLEALDASKQDAEEGQTSSPSNTEGLLSDSVDDTKMFDESNKDVTTFAPINSETGEGVQTNEEDKKELQKVTSEKESSLDPHLESSKEEGSKMKIEKKEDEQNIKKEVDKDDF